MLDSGKKLDKNLMHKLAVLNPYGSVSAVMDEYDSPFVGVKDVSAMPMDYVSEHFGQVHTYDKSSLGGRAVDVMLKNPVTGLPMTGSSSGTAINVFVGINDIGVGLDGGGSVLAPAMSLNLFSYVNPNLASEDLDPLTKVSTDGISFRPSLGFMTRSFEELSNLIEWEEDCDYSELVVDVDVSAQRKELISYLHETLPTCDFLISREGPIDTEGFGDTVLGHFPNMHEHQLRANKGLIRVVNMAQAAAVTIPTKDFAVADVLICEPSQAKIDKMMTYTKSIACERDELIARYFENLEMYFDGIERE